jgi:mono/diheme cytochrome c family protein
MIEKYLDVGEFRRLFSTLLVVLCCIAIAGLFAVLVVPGLRNANRPATPTAIQPVVGESGWLDPTEFTPEKGMVIPPVDPASLIQPSQELRTQGKELFAKNCVPCHGALGHGDGPAAGTMDPRPRNLSSPAGWINGFDLPGIYRTLSEGIKKSSMVAFDYLSRKDRMALAHHVQSLGGFDSKSGSPEAMEALSRELATAGEKIPNKIPVSLAMAKLEQEFVDVKLPAIRLYLTEPDDELLLRVIVDPSRASRVLMQSEVWRQSAQDLAVSILPDVPGNGFSDSTATLSPSEWKALYAQLLKRMKQE